MGLTVSGKELGLLLRRAHVGAFKGATGLPIAKRFLFTQGRILGSSGSVCASIPFPQWTLPDASVDGALLEKVVKSLDGDLEIEVDRVFKVRCGKASVSLPLQEPHAEFYPTVQGAWVPIPRQFPSLVSACAFANRTDYAGVAIRKVDGGSVIVGTDQSKIYYSLLPESLPESWLSVDAALALAAVGDEGEAVSADDMWVHVKYTDGTIFSALTMQAADYPVQDLYAYTQLFQGAEGDVCGEFTPEMCDAVKQASIFAGGASGRKLVSFEYSGKSLRIAAEGAGGSYSCEMGWDGGDVDFAVTIDAQFLITAKPQQLKLTTANGLTVLLVPGDVSALVALDVL